MEINPAYKIHNKTEIKFFFKLRFIFFTAFFEEIFPDIFNPFVNFTALFLKVFFTIQGCVAVSILFLCIVRFIQWHRMKGVLLFSSIWCKVCTANGLCNILVARRTWIELIILLQLIILFSLQHTEDLVKK